jgi:hypothetical protein
LVTRVGFRPLDGSEKGGSIFRENLCFNGEQYRTTRLIEAVHQIYLIESGLGQNINGTSKVNFDLCRSAERKGNEPNLQYVGYQIFDWPVGDDAMN